MKPLFFSILGVFFSVQVHAQSAASQPYKPGASLKPGEPQLLFSFPDYIAQPDGMAVDPEGNVFFSCPNSSAPAYPGLLVKITPDYQWEVAYNLPAHPTTHKAVPMGISFGPDGNLYIADNQYNLDSNFQSRILRLNMENGKPVGVDVVAKGLKHPNALRWHKNDLYITDTKWRTSDDMHTSGIFRIASHEMENDSVQIQPSMEERHLIATFEAIPQDGNDLGTDGMDFDSQGNLFVGMFTDGRVFKLTFDQSGAVNSKEEFLKLGTIPCCDGIFIDKTTDHLYIADSELNAIHVVTKKGEVRTLAKNGDTDGADGGLDQPCEPLLVGDKLFVANYDQPNSPSFVNKQADGVHTMSIIQVPAEFLSTQSTTQR
ncbi:SMP-30/Gluconolaconase/LRE-like region-containing protein [Catalinimonas alkaloidigena]|uniref:SMP-30/Gluconolaconase/LRE-like region-containing protein n=1 Tax=Catalinimonas alkaloidigena TaxID=1075417 RepID=A0A1G9NF51_9BACT|nr:SMP-30/gluconolactonase/LRE family protein [Catalinimonas alkaloidigena]SDL84667.1 SMP-30/Gluconolaconase/LRE-like region-containing protein [Catalinimonas alkaloidigena]